MDEKKLEALKAEHPNLKLVVLRAPGGEEVVVRRPNREIWKRYIGAMMTDDRKLDAGENLLKTCLVFPDPSGFEALVDDAPGLVMTFTGALMDVAGFSPGEKVEKKAVQR